MRSPHEQAAFVDHEVQQFHRLPSEGLTADDEFDLLVRLITDNAKLVILVVGNRFGEYPGDELSVRVNPEFRVRLEGKQEFGVIDLVGTAQYGVGRGAGCLEPETDGHVSQAVKGCVVQLQYVIHAVKRQGSGSRKFERYVSAAQHSTRKCAVFFVAGVICGHQASCFIEGPVPAWNWNAIN